MGWNTDVGGPVMALLGTAGALTGYITDDRFARRGRTDVTGRSNAVLEAEIAIRMGGDLPAGSVGDQALDALASAIGIADVDLPFEDPEELLAGNLFYRGVIFSPFENRARSRLRN